MGLTVPHEFGVGVWLVGTCLAAVLLCLSKTCRYYLKFFTYFSGVYFVVGFLIPVFALRPFNEVNFVFASAILKNISRLIGIQWTLRGSEHLAKQEACVIVANHQSSLDILGMFHIWAIMKKCTVIAKKEMFYVWPFGLGAWLCGLIYIDRVNSGRAKEVINKEVNRIKKDQIKLWFFPEGTRRNTGDIHAFKKGAFHVAISAQLPILPVVYSPFYFLDDARRTFTTGNVIISALPPISTRGLTLNDIDKLMDEVRITMIVEFNKMRKEVKSDLNSQCRAISLKTEQF